MYEGTFVFKMSIISFIEFTKRRPAVSGLRTYTTAAAARVCMFCACVRACVVASEISEEQKLKKLN